MVTFVAAAQSAKWPMKYNLLKCTNEMPYWKSTDNSKINDSCKRSKWLIRYDSYHFNSNWTPTNSGEGRMIENRASRDCHTIRNDRIDQDRTRQRICQFFVNYMLVDLKLIFWISFNRSPNYFYFFTNFVIYKIMRGSILRFFLILKVKKWSISSPTSMMSPNLIILTHF